jgi:flagellar assembly protein FliH
MAHHVTRVGWVQHGQVSATAAELPELEDLPPPEEDLSGGEFLPEEVHARLVMVEHEAHTRIAAAHAQAESRVAEALAEAERWRQHALATEADAYQRGFSAGYADGAQQGRAEADAAVRAETRALVAQITTLAKRARTDLRTGILAAQAGLADLSLAVARAVIDEAVRLDPDLLARRINALLAQVGDATIAVVRVCPADFAALQPLWPVATRARRNGERGPRIVADDTLAPGDCIIEGHTRYFDARLEPLFAVVQEAFAALPAPVPHQEPQNDDGKDWAA